MLRLSIMNLINSILKRFSIRLTKLPKKNSSMVQNKTKYAFVQREVDDFSCIKITSGPYEGVIYTYGQVKFASEENKQGELPLKFTYNVQRNINDVDTESEEFRFAIGDILIEVMEKQLKEGKLNINDPQTRNDNTN